MVRKCHLASKEMLGSGQAGTRGWKLKRTAMEPTSTRSPPGVCDLPHPELASPALCCQDLTCTTALAVRVPSPLDHSLSLTRPPSNTHMCCWSQSRPQQQDVFRLTTMITQFLTPYYRYLGTRFNSRGLSRMPHRPWMKDSGMLTIILYQCMVALRMILTL